MWDEQKKKKGGEGQNGSQSADTIGIWPKKKHKIVGSWKGGTGWYVDQ